MKGSSTSQESERPVNSSDGTRRDDSGLHQYYELFQALTDRKFHCQVINVPNCPSNRGATDKENLESLSNPAADNNRTRDRKTVMVKEDTLRTRKSKELPVENYLQVLQQLIALKKLYLSDEELDRKLEYLEDQLFDEILPAMNK